MNLLIKINNLFSYDRYYKMTDDELIKEVQKYNLKHIYNNWNFNLDRTEAIKQLVSKDNASMFKKSIIISAFVLVVAIISLIISVIAIFLK